VLWLPSFFHSVISQSGGGSRRKAVAAAPICEQQIGQMRD
jgi:hypothetical protein